MTCAVFLGDDHLPSSMLYSFRPRIPLADMVKARLPTLGKDNSPAARGIVSYRRWKSRDFYANLRADDMNFKDFVL